MAGTNPHALSNSDNILPGLESNFFGYAGADALPSANVNPRGSSSATSSVSSTTGSVKDSIDHMAMENARLKFLVGELQDKLSMTGKVVEEMAKDVAFRQQQNSRNPKKHDSNSQTDENFLLSKGAHQIHAVDPCLRILELEREVERLRSDLAQEANDKTKYRLKWEVLRSKISKRGNGKAAAGSVNNEGGSSMTGFDDDSLRSHPSLGSSSPFVDNLPRTLFNMGMRNMTSKMNPNVISAVSSHKRSRRGSSGSDSDDAPLYTGAPSPLLLSRANSLPCVNSHSSSGPGHIGLGRSLGAALGGVLGGVRGATHLPKRERSRSWDDLRQHLGVSGNANALPETTISEATLTAAASGGNTNQYQIFNHYHHDHKADVPDINFGAGFLPSSRWDREPAAAAATPPGPGSNSYYSRMSFAGSGIGPLSTGVSVYTLAPEDEPRRGGWRQHEDF